MIMFYPNDPMGVLYFGLAIYLSFILASMSGVSIIYFLSTFFFFFGGTLVCKCILYFVICLSESTSWIIDPCTIQKYVEIKK